MQTVKQPRLSALGGMVPAFGLHPQGQADAIGESGEPGRRSQRG
jgi:hypothetical protein